MSVSAAKEALTGAGGPPVEGSRRPNVVLVVTDQHRPDHTGFGGGSLVQTPNLDALAARGTVFDRAYVANPICMPNRSTILTGRMPSVHGVRFNGIPLDWGANTFVRVLRNNGYRTGLVGKSHLQNMGHAAAVRDAFFSDPDDSVTAGWPQGWDQWEDLARHENAWVELPPDFYGFDHVELLVDHSDHCGGHYHQWLIEKGADPASILGPANMIEAPDCGWDQVYKPALPEELYPTTYAAERAIAFLEKAAGSGEPFFLQLSFPDPHHPFTPPGHYYDMYDPADVEMPPTFDDAHERSSPALRAFMRSRGVQPMIPVAPFACTEEQYRQSAAKEYGMISMIDDKVGEVLASLDRLGLADDTIVIFTSDHGEMFGDHGLMLKGGMHYQGCIRVPLVVALPGAAPARTSSLVGSIDVAQTVLDLCGFRAYHGMQGTSFVPVLDDPSASVRDHVYIEEDEMFDTLGTGRPLRMRTIVTDEARVTRYEGTDFGELFDLAGDPGEMVNLYEDPAPASTAMRAAMNERLMTALIRYADDAPKPSAIA